MLKLMVLFARFVRHREDHLSEQVESGQPHHSETGKNLLKK